MTTQVPLDELLKQCRSFYKLTVIAANRAKELMEGSPKLVEGEFKNVASIAIEEIRQGKIRYKPSEDDAEALGEKTKPAARRGTGGHAKAGRREASKRVKAAKG